MRVKVREYVYYPKKKGQDNSEIEQNKQKKNVEVAGVTSLQNTPSDSFQNCEQDVVTTFNRFDPLNTDAARKNL